MRFITFDKAYLPDSPNITKAVACTVNVDHVSMVLPLEDDISGARSALTVDGSVIHVDQSPDEVMRLLNSASAA